MNKADLFILRKRIGALHPKAGLLQQARIGIVMLCTFLMAPAILSQATPIEKPRAAELRPFAWQNMSALRYNPLGLFNETRLGYRHWLYDGSEKRILKGSYLGASAVAFTSPALAMIGADLEASPLPIFNLPWVTGR